ncbi:MAG TPA: PA14 domain-containing protein, partial [Pirellulaceae bacterium]|nr:PA14 domain-containing protein [Pirellulaceae bacterium]
MKQFTSWRRVSSALTLVVGFFSTMASGVGAPVTIPFGGSPFAGTKQLAAAETKLEPKSGEQIFRELCAKCHGAKGEGTAEHHPRQLMGDKSTVELADVIAKTMPEDDPSKCVGDDAKRVAEYMQSAFYSPEAQARLNPPRIELSRLTVRQYRHAVADVVNSFRSPLTWSSERGLRGEYYKTRRYRGDERVLEQVDSVVKFDFGEESPVKDKIDPVEFALRWQGSVFAPETGEYEFVIRTENGARLWVNDVDKPLIDAWVKSGKDVTERRETIWLLGGRVYPIKLEMFKSKEAKEKRASVALLWKQPHRAVELIPSQYLAPVKNPESLVIETPFPPDDRSIGYERGTAISKAWDQATTDAAIEAAAYIGSHLRELSGSREGDANRAEALKKFCAKFAERAFRRPLTDEQRAIVVDRQFSATAAPVTPAAPANTDAPAGTGAAAAPDAAVDLDLAVKRSVLLVLMSPRFLYRELIGPNLDSYDVASR